VRAAKLATQIKNDINLLASMCKSDLHHIVVKYHAATAPGLEEVDLPVSLHRHVLDPHRTVKHRHNDVLLFHLGDAVVAYQFLARGQTTDLAYATIVYFHELVTLLADGQSLVVDGDDRTGHALMTPALIGARDKAKQHVSTIRATEVGGLETNDAGGGTGSESVVEGDGV